MTMTNEIAAFDPDALKKKVAAHIQNTFSALIPDDVFGSMVDKAIKDFFENRQLLQVSRISGGYYNEQQDRFRTEVNCTMFEALVYEMIFTLMQSEVKKYLTEYEAKVRAALAEQVVGNMKIEESITANLQAFVLRATENQILHATSVSYSQAVGKVAEAFSQAGQWDIATRLRS